MERDHAENEDIIYFVQYHLHVQLKEAAEYAQSKGIILKGDLPIGIYRNSVETRIHPEFFHLSKQMGTPPSNEYPNGQNWGFPSYDWSSWKDKKGIIDWFHRRLEHLSQYFDALRIDHIIGYFRSWEIPEHAISASLGHYTPSLPMSEEEIGQFGIVFRKDLFTHPFINDSALQKIFGIHANYVRDNFLIHKGYGLYDLKDDFNTQIKVRNHFHGQTDENSQWIRDGLYRLIANVLFIEDEGYVCSSGIDKQFEPAVVAKQALKAVLMKTSTATDGAVLVMTQNGMCVFFHPSEDIYHSSVRKGNKGRPAAFFRLPI